MKPIRIIARLDIKAPNLIKGVNLEGVRVVGDPRAFATRYYQEGIDEIVYMDAVATLYGRNSLAGLVSDTAEHVYVPMTVGGGLRSIEDVDAMMRAGADKIAINTAALKRPEVLREVSRRFGCQAMVLSVEAKRRRAGDGWEAYVDNGREKTGRDVIDWVCQAAEHGIGEILLTSVDQEGTCAGFDIPLLRAVTDAVHVPVVASGGMGRLDHAVAAVQEGGADAIAMAHVLHYRKLSLHDIRDHLARHGIEVRHP
jgi:imidazole glycerol-phosphate synthase subunit HisF